MELYSCFYTSKDITYEEVTGIPPKLWGRLILTFLCCFLFLAIYTSLALGFSLLTFRAEERRIWPSILITCWAIPFFAELAYMMVVCNIATVVTVLEEDCYGSEALWKSMDLTEGKEWVSRAVFGLLGIAFTGISFTYYLSVYGDCLVGKVVGGIGLHLLLAICVHFLLVVHTVLYFVCKSYHNEDISTVSTHFEILVIHLGKEKDVQLERVPAV
ncbi:uncharacterized protein LOC113331329 [Papaver somniferum]|uniref:uncharacterized protein LOC113331329 n=1 Tax=Papaver somniferum TaxID=3469 RepID=UPI000E7047BA|nr:uncharacterized protein LOC113331329 [Papaver somniferum]